MKYVSRIALHVSTAFFAALVIFPQPELHAEPAAVEQRQSILLESMQNSQMDFKQLTQLEPGDSTQGRSPVNDPERKTVANGLYMTGAFTAVWAGGLTTVKLTGEIRNESFTRTSGTLQLQLWATTTPPPRGGAFSGYRLARSPNITALPPRTFYTNYEFTTAFLYPPDGTYWLVLSLAEHDTVACASFSDVFCVNQDSMNSNTTSTFGTPPAQVTYSLENPQPSSFQSGIGLLSGWSCQGPNIGISIDGGAIQTVPYGSGRGDVTSVCGAGNAYTGFGLLTNFNLYGPGVHSAQLYVNGVPKGSPSYFTVTVPFGEFLTGVSSQVTVPNFPNPGRTATLIWQQSTQNFGIKSVSP